MTRLAKKLKERVSILKPIQIANTDGGFDRTYEILSTIWANIKPDKFASYMRNMQVETKATHLMECRKIAVDGLGASFSNGFTYGFPRIGSINILKSNYYVFRQEGGEYGDFSAGFSIDFSQTEGVIGDLYKILGGKDPDLNNEMLVLQLEAIEEQGTGLSL